MKNPVKLLITLLFSILSVLLTSCASVAPSLPSQPITAPQSGANEIALLLPLSGPYGNAGQAVRDGFFDAYYQNRSSDKIHVYDTNANNIINLYHTAINNGARIIVGPLDKASVSQLATTQLSAPVIALNSLPGNINPPSQMIQFGLSPQNEAVLAAIRAFNDGHRNMLILYPGNAWGIGIANAFSRQWRSQGANIVVSLPYQNNASLADSIRTVLQVSRQAASAKPKPGQAINAAALRRQDIDSIFIVATPALAKQIVPLLRYYYAGNLPMYSISTLYNGTQNSLLNMDLNGVYFCDMPWIFNNSNDIQKTQAQLAQYFPSMFQSYTRLYALGLDAYQVSRNIDYLQQNPNATINGVTGTLYIRNQQVLRNLQWAQFQNGFAVQVS